MDIYGVWGVLHTHRGVYGVGEREAEFPRNKVGVKGQACSTRLAAHTVGDGMLVDGAPGTRSPLNHEFTSLKGYITHAPQ